MAMNDEPGPIKLDVLYAQDDHIFEDIWNFKVTCSSNTNHVVLFFTI
jgi:hypothetical protein